MNTTNKRNNPMTKLTLVSCLIRAREGKNLLNLFFDGIFSSWPENVFLVYGGGID